MVGSSKVLEKRIETKLKKIQTGLMELQIVLKKTDSTRQYWHTSSCLRLATMKFMSSSLQNMERIFLTIQNRYYEDEAYCNEINNTWY